MPDRVGRRTVRQLGALALLVVVIAAASWAVASGVHGGRRLRVVRIEAVSSRDAARLPSFDTTLPGLRHAHRRGVGRAVRRSARDRHAHATAAAPRTTVAATASAPPAQPASSGGAPSSGSGGSTADVPPTGGPPAP